MWYAIITALFGTIFAAGYKMATTLKSNRTVVNAVLLVGAAIMTGVLGLATDGLEFNRTVIITGVSAGISVYSCVAAFFQVMRYGRLAVQWTVINMAIAVPAIVSVVLWGERPTGMMIVGFVLTVAAMVLMGVDRGTTAHTDDSGEGLNPAAGRRGKILWIVLILIAYFGTGLTQVFNKALVHYGEGGNKLTYLFLMYCVAGALSLIHLAISRPSVHWRDFGVGGCMAVMSLLCTWCLILGLEHMDAIVFYPLRSICSILFTTGLSVFLWREKVHKVGIIGLVLATLAICALSMPSAL